jgi:hypothetical protein
MVHPILMYEHARESGAFIGTAGSAHPRALFAEGLLRLTGPAIFQEILGPLLGERLGPALIARLPSGDEAQLSGWEQVRFQRVWIPSVERRMSQAMHRKVVVLACESEGEYASAVLGPVILCHRGLLAPIDVAGVVRLTPQRLDTRVVSQWEGFIFDKRGGAS